MRLVVCVKQVPDEQNMRTDPETGSLLRDTAGSVPNAADAFALEMARTARKLADVEPPVLDAVTMGPKQARSSLRQALSLGFDNAYQLLDARFSGSDSYVTARTLALAIQKTGGADLIFCGEKSSDGDTGQVPAELSVQMKAAFLPFVTELIDVSHEHIVVRSVIDDSEYVMEASYPAVVQVKADSVKIIPASYRERSLALKKPIHFLKAEDITPENRSPEELFGYRYSPTRVLRMHAPDHTRSPIRYRGQEAVRKLQELLAEDVEIGKNGSLGTSVCDSEEKITNKSVTGSLYGLSGERAVVYCEASEKGFRNALELISHLQSAGVPQLHAVTVCPRFPGDSLSTGADASVRGSITSGGPLSTGADASVRDPKTACEERLASLVGDDLFKTLLDNVDCLTVIQSRHLYVTAGECAFYLTRYLRTCPSGLCLLSATDHGRSAGPLTAAGLKTGITADITDLRYVDGLWQQVRPAFGGQVEATIITPEHCPVLATVRPRTFADTLLFGGRHGTTDVFEIDDFAEEKSAISVRHGEPSERQTDGTLNQTDGSADFPKIISATPIIRETPLQDAKRILIMGGAVTTKAERDFLIAFARENGMEWGASRALVRGNLAPYERQIGVSGLTAAPDFALLVGVSGTIQTMTGLRRAGIIAAVNCDENAPIFENVDVVLIGNWQEMIGEPGRLFR